MGGLTGLDYAGMWIVVDIHAVPSAERRERFNQIRLLERGALEAMREQAKR